MPPQLKAKAKKPPPLPIRVLQAIVHSNSFNALMTLTILFNCATFVLDGNDVSRSTQSFMDISNLICLIIFTVEMVLVATADGLKEYVSSGWGKFDILVVGLSWIVDNVSDSGSLSVFRILRVLRPLRLLKRIGSLQDLLEMYGLSFGAFASVYLILFVGLMLFALVGMQIFSYVPLPASVCMREITLNVSSFVSLAQGNVSNATAAVSASSSRVTSFVPLVGPGLFGSYDQMPCRPNEENVWWDERCRDSLCRTSSLLPPTLKRVSSISRSSFDSFGPALFTVSCMVQLEGWSDLMYDSMHTVSAVMPLYWISLVSVLAFGLNW